MAKNKIERIDQEITKVREKIAEYQEKLKALEVQKTEAENLEIVQIDVYKRQSLYRSPHRNYSRTAKKPCTTASTPCPTTSSWWTESC